MLQQLWMDIRHAARAVAKRPGITSIAVISIAIGVGANVAMFSVADALVFRPLPIPSPSEVVTVSATTPGLGFRNVRLSHPEYDDLRRLSASFDDLVAYRFVTAGVAEGPNDTLQRTLGAAVSGNLFSAMRVRPSLGRAFRPEEDVVVGRDLVVILDYDEWARRYGRDVNVVGRSLRIGASTFTIVGVAPDDFSGIDAVVRPAFYIPLAANVAAQRSAVDDRARRDAYTLTVKGRLRPGTSLDEASADVSRTAATLERTYATSRSRGFAVRTEFQARTAQGAGANDAPIVAALLTFSLIVLAVACANVAGLLASRAPERSREVALRFALGAGRVRLMRQLLLESLFVAGLGGAAGLGLGSVVIAAFRRVELPTDVPLKLTFEMDGRVFAVGLLLATTSAVVSSLVPAWRATRGDLQTPLRESSTRASQSSRLWGRSALVCGQVGLALVLLTVATSLFGVFRAELDRGPGFKTNNLVMAAFDTSLAGYDEARSREFQRQLKALALALPGVTNATLTSTVPMKTDSIDLERLAPLDFELPTGVRNIAVLASTVDDDYFDTFDIRILQGRAFGTLDGPQSRAVVVVNETFATRYWPNQNPLGKRVRLDERNGVTAEVIGVAANAKYTWLGESPTEFVYLPRTQVFSPESTLIVAYGGDAASIFSGLREGVRISAPEVPVFGMRTMEDFYRARAVHTTNLIVGSVAGMGGAGLLLAMVGLYGLVAYNTGRRTREIGIRVAVGAEPLAVLGLVLKQGLLLLAGGSAIGLLASLAAGQVLRAAFPIASGVSTITQLGVLATALAVTGLAIFGPARRALRVDPIVALRSE